MAGNQGNRPPRFIAGAVCPRCGVMDRIVVSGDGDQRHCIDCGFSDDRPSAAPEQVATRVTRPAARRVETEAQVVRMLDIAVPAEEKKPGE